MPQPTDTAEISSAKKTKSFPNNISSHHNLRDTVEISFAKKIKNFANNII